MELYIYKVSNQTIICKKVNNVKETKKMYVYDEVMPLICLMRVPKHEVNSKSINSYGAYISTEDNFDKAKDVFVEFYKTKLRYAEKVVEDCNRCLNFFENQEEAL